MLLEWLPRKQCNHPVEGRTLDRAFEMRVKGGASPAPSRVDQHVAVGMATERSVTTRLKDGLPDAEGALGLDIKLSGRSS